MDKDKKDMIFTITDENLNSKDVSEEEFNNIMEFESQNIKRNMIIEEEDLISIGFEKKTFNLQELSKYIKDLSIFLNDEPYISGCSFGLSINTEDKEQPFFYMKNQITYNLKKISEEDFESIYKDLKKINDVAYKLPNENSLTDYLLNSIAKEAIFIPYLPAHVTSNSKDFLYILIQRLERTYNISFG